MTFRSTNMKEDSFAKLCKRVWEPVEFFQIALELLMGNMAAKSGSLFFIIISLYIYSYFLKHFHYFSVVLHSIVTFCIRCIILFYIPRHWSMVAKETRNIFQNSKFGSRILNNSFDFLENNASLGENRHILLLQKTHDDYVHG